VKVKVKVKVKVQPQLPRVRLSAKMKMKVKSQSGFELQKGGMGQQKSIHRAREVPAVSVPVAAVG
jgi:hypothetical protein